MLALNLRVVMMREVLEILEVAVHRMAEVAEDTMDLAVVVEVTLGVVSVDHLHMKEVVEDMEEVTEVEVMAVLSSLDHQEVGVEVDLAELVVDLTEGSVQVDMAVEVVSAEKVGLVEVVMEVVVVDSDSTELLLNKVHQVSDHLDKVMFHQSVELAVVALQVIKLRAVILQAAVAWVVELATAKVMMVTTKTEKF